MDEILELFICSRYQAEVEEIIRSEGWQDVKVVFQVRACSNPREKAPDADSWLKELQNKDNVVVLYCQRTQSNLSARNFLWLPQCYYMFVNQTLLEESQKRGYVILAPGWLAHWRENLAEMGLDQAAARQFFHDKKGFLLFDTGVYAQINNHLSDFGKYLNKPVHSTPVGLAFLRLYLTQIVSAWRNQKYLQKIEKMNAEANRTIADYVMVIDLLTHLTQLYTEEELQNEISDLFTMLFSFGDVVYYPVKEERLLQTQSHRLMESDLQNLQTWLESDEAFRYTPSGRGFFLRIEHKNQVLGVLLADNLTLPQYMEQYLSLSLEIAKLCGLSIANVRNYQKLEKAEVIARREQEIAESLRLTMIEMAEGLGRKDLLERILISLRRVIPFTEALVYLKQGDVMEFKLGLRSSPAGTLETYTPSEKYTRVHVTWDTSKPQTQDDVERTPALRQYVNPRVARSWIGLYLIQQGEVIGLLSISNRAAHVYNQETVALALAFGGQVSIALENARLFSELTEAAMTDGLTGLYNRRHFYQQAAIEFGRSQRYKRPLSAVMMDIDHFKKVNDTYGHPVGDQVLKWFANLCLQNKRGADIVGRYGGEEFVMLLPETGMEDAAIFAERLRSLIERTPALTSKGAVPITCSLGISSLTEKNVNLEQMLDQSDTALYEAKKNGRNQVRCWQGG